MRTIKVASTKTNEVKDITAENDLLWGQLKVILEAGGIDLQDVKVTERNTKVTLEDAGAQVPNGDIILFITPDKVKSGKYGGI